MLIKKGIPLKSAGIYFLIGPMRDIVYIGQSGNVLTRLGNHQKDPKKFFTHYRIIGCNNEERRKYWEKYLITKYNPVYNKNYANHSKWSKQPRLGCLLNHGKYYKPLFGGSGYYDRGLKEYMIRDPNNIKTFAYLTQEISPLEAYKIETKIFQDPKRVKLWTGLMNRWKEWCEDGVVSKIDPNKPLLGDLPVDQAIKYGKKWSEKWLEKNLYGSEEEWNPPGGQVANFKTVTYASFNGKEKQALDYYKTYYVYLRSDAPPVDAYWMDIGSVSYRFPTTLGYLNSSDIGCTMPSAHSTSLVSTGAPKRITDDTPWPPQNGDVFRVQGNDYEYLNGAFNKL